LLTFATNLVMAGHLARPVLNEMAGSVAGHDGRATACVSL
jgi:hypothetical protein